MSKDKYPSIFSPQMEAIVFIILQIFYATRAVLKIGEYPRIFPSFGWGIFAHVTRLDQSRASENIWWIIMLDIGQVLFLCVYGPRRAEQVWSKEAFRVVLFRASSCKDHSYKNIFRLQVNIHTNPIHFHTCIYGFARALVLKQRQKAGNSEIACWKRAVWLIL